MPRLFGPDGQHEHRPLRLVEVAPQDLAVLAATAGRLGHALALTGSELAEAIEAGVEAANPASYSTSPTTGVELVEVFARVNGQLDLATTADTEILTARLWSDGCSDIVATPAATAGIDPAAGTSPVGALCAYHQFSTMLTRSEPPWPRRRSTSEPASSRCRGR
ncbi:hypothetical protein ACLFMI_11360 [Pseudonocardia nantongensis]|uniref:hypothetical protein n=1 Tax=Pseudonocardia nantongensis TaxID=1181885 RepID=UPI003979D2A1